jgi:hypothetical protein
LSELLGRDVTFLPDCVGEETKKAVLDGKDGLLASRTAFLVSSPTQSGRKVTSRPRSSLNLAWTGLSEYLGLGEPSGYQVCYRQRCVPLPRRFTLPSLHA